MSDILADGAIGTPVDRREFMKLTATGLVVLIAIDPVGAIQESARPQGARQGYPTDLNAYLHVGTDGRVTCYVGKVELGQGAMTSLAQLLAEELDVAPASVKVIMGDTDLCPWDMGTFGSLSVRQFGPVLRQAGADARATLLDMASVRLQVPVERLTVTDGTIRDTADRTKSVTYAQLTEGKRIERTVTAKVAVKAVGAFTTVGQSLPRYDAIEKVTGAAAYAGDVVPPGGALHARILRPPSHFATLVSVDTSAAERRAGVTVIRDGDMIAVLHAHRDEADAALALVKAEWKRSDPPEDNETIFEHFLEAAPPARVAAEGGVLADGERASAAHLRAHVLRQLLRARADGTARGGRGHRERQGHGLGGNTNAIPAQDAGDAGAEAPGRQGARHHALRRRRVWRQVGVPAGGRGSAPGKPDGQTRARPVEP